MSDKSYLTAISRKTLPKPTQWLLDHGHMTVCPSVKVLDYGCGRCFDINPKEWDNYDPNFCEWTCRSLYDQIVCNYVLCVLPRTERMPVLQGIQRLLKKHGRAFISVRNDKPKQGWGKSSKGTYQGRVAKLGLPLLYECDGFRIYMLTKATKLVS